MYMLTIYRQAMQRLVMRKIGLRLANDNIYAAQRVSAAHHGEVFKLPPNIGVTSLQDIDTESPTFGAPFFMVGISAVGGPDIVA